MAVVDGPGDAVEECHLLDIEKVHVEDNVGMMFCNVSWDGGWYEDGNVLLIWLVSCMTLDIGNVGAVDDPGNPILEHIN